MEDMDIERGHPASGEDIDIDIDFATGMEEDYVLEDVEPGQDDLMIDDDHLSYQMEDAEILQDEELLDFQAEEPDLMSFSEQPDVSRAEQLRVEAHEHDEHEYYQDTAQAQESGVGTPVNDEHGYQQDTAPIHESGVDFAQVDSTQATTKSASDEQTESSAHEAQALSADNELQEQPDHIDHVVEHGYTQIVTQGHESDAHEYDKHEYPQEDVLGGDNEEFDEHEYLQDDAQVEEHKYQPDNGKLEEPNADARGTDSHEEPRTVEVSEGFQEINHIQTSVQPASKMQIGHLASPKLPHDLPASSVNNELFEEPDSLDQNTPDNKNGNHETKSYITHAESGIMARDDEHEYEQDSAEIEEPGVQDQEYDEHEDQEQTETDLENLPSQANVDSAAVEASFENFQDVFNIPEVLVNYRSHQYVLFATPELDDVNSYFLSDPAIMEQPLPEFFQAIREVIHEDLSDEDEVHLSIAVLGLKISEMSDSVSNVTLSALVELHEKLLHNEGQQLSPLRISLESQPNFLKQLEKLRAGAAEGKGLHELISQEEVDSLLGSENYEDDFEQFLEGDEYLAEEAGTEHLAKEEGDNHRAEGEEDEHLAEEPEINAVLTEPDDCPTSVGTIKPNNNLSRVDKLATEDGKADFREHVLHNGLDEDGDLIDYSDDEENETSKDSFGFATDKPDKGKSNDFIPPCVLPQFCICPKCSASYLAECEEKHDSLRRQSLDATKESLDANKEEQSNEDFTILLGVDATASNGADTAESSVTLGVEDEIQYEDGPDVNYDLDTEQKDEIDYEDDEDDEEEGSDLPLVPVQNLPPTKEASPGNGKRSRPEFDLDENSPKRLRS